MSLEWEMTLYCTEESFGINEGTLESHISPNSPWSMDVERCSSTQGSGKSLKSVGDL